MKKLHSSSFIRLLKSRRRAAKFTILVCLLFFSNPILSQTDLKLHQIKPNWKLGEQKKVHSVSGTKIFIEDTLFSSTEAIANYNIKIVDTVENYTLLYFTERNSIDIETEPVNPNIDSVVNSLADIMKEMDKEIQFFKYELLVDKNTGQAFEVKNSNSFLKTIEEFSSTLIEKLSKIDKSSIQIDSLKQQVSAHIKMAEPKILETVINQFNYIMQSYSYEFPYNSSISQKSLVQDVNALGEFGGIDMPATLTISSKQYDNILTIQTDTDYDKDFLLEQIKKKHKSMSNLTSSDVFLSEKTEATFTTVDGWIVSHKSNIVFEAKEVKVINATTVSFK